MQYRYLGRTGLKVSELCLGAMTFGRESSEEVSYQMLDCFVEAGGNFIDTANVYSQGLSEEILGRWLHGQTTAITSSSLRKCVSRWVPAPTIWA